MAAITMLILTPMESPSVHAMKHRRLRADQGDCFSQLKRLGSSHVEWCEGCRLAKKCPYSPQNHPDAPVPIDEDRADLLKIVER